MKRFLRYVVEQALEGRHDELKEYSIALSAFDKPASFDSRLDPIVRVEAGRLRAKLREYYESASGQNEEIRIHIPKRSYAPQFDVATDVTAVNKTNPVGGTLDFPEGLSPRSATLAVLPFADLSPRRDQEYFCDGITEELTNALSHVEGLHVVSRTSSMQYKGASTDIRRVGEQLNAGAVLEGSVRKARDKVRIAVQLIDTRNGYHLWAETYERKLGDVFVVQEEISRSVARTLSNRLVNGSAIRFGTKVVRAYQLYLRGRSFWKRNDRTGLAKAIRYFRQAISTDPRYARAYLGLAECQVTRAWLGFAAPGPGWRDAAKAAVKALEIDPELGPASASLAVVKAAHEWDWRASEHRFSRALELDPGHATTPQWYALFCLAPQARTEEALLQITRARELDPTSPAVAVHLARILYFARRYPEAVEQCEAAAQVDVFFPLAYYYLGFALERQGLLVPALKAFGRAVELSDGDPNALSAYGYCLARNGTNREALDVVNEIGRLATKRYVSPVHLAMLHLGLSNREAAFAALDRARVARCSRLIHLAVDPVFDPLKTDPRMAKLLEAMALDPPHVAVGAS
ncbi:MAG: tetratricopeptide repeat protein [Bryobacterales bacterium]|nr:tetratricopeptide repeat protein [Bryobacterales bacterium]